MRLIAHRGASGLAPENTLAAFRLALELGAEAVEFYRKAWPEVDLVILDMVMPRMGGKDAFLEMQKINPQVKALIVSGFSVEGEAQHLLDSGALGFLQKPYRRIELARMVAKALKG